MNARRIDKERFERDSESQSISWKDIAGHEGYRVSDRPLIMRDYPVKGATLALSVVKISGEDIFPVATRQVRKNSPYVCFDVYKQGSRRPAGTFTLHNVRARTFLGDPPQGTTGVRHLDGDGRNNDLKNLAWGSQQEQGEDIALHGSQKGEKNASAKINSNKAVAIYVLASLKLINEYNSKAMCGIGGSALRRMLYESGWSHAITEEIRQLVAKALEIAERKTKASQERQERECKSLVDQALREYKTRIRRSINSHAKNLKDSLECEEEVSGPDSVSG